jgi:hypothetical protein
MGAAMIEQELSEYERGYLDGYRYVQAEVRDPAARPRVGEVDAERRTLTEVQAAEDPSDDLIGGSEADYWLGYYHGQYHARTGAPPPGAAGRVPAGLHAGRP